MPAVFLSTTTPVPTPCPTLGILDTPNATVVFGLFETVIGMAGLVLTSVMLRLSYITYKEKRFKRAGRGNPGASPESSPQIPLSSMPTTSAANRESSGGDEQTLVEPPDEE